MNVYRVLIKEPGNDLARWFPVDGRMVEARTDAEARKRAARLFPLFDVHVERAGEAWE